MKIEVTLTNRHAVLLASAIVIAGILGAFAFGGSNPAVMGHSALELIVNSTSIVDNSITSADILDDTITDTDILAGSISGSRIDETSLNCAQITGGASLCDGSDADTVGLTSVDQSAFNTCGGATTCSVSCGSGSMVGCGCEPSSAQPINDHHITGNTCTCGTTVATTINVRGICIS